MMKRILFFLILLIPAILLAQDYKESLRKGNELYKEKKYDEAEVQYLKSMQDKEHTYRSIFNLGDALYKQEKYDLATQKFQDMISKDMSKDELASAYHNLGNSFLQEGKYKESIDAYKNSLRNNPDDLETKYNLEYARKKLIQQQQQQQQQQNQDQNKDQEQKQDQQQQDQQDKKDQKDQQQQQQQDQQDKKDQKDQQQQQDQQDKKDQKDQQQQQDQQDVKISKEDAERILQALNNEEKKLQQDLKKKKQKGAAKTGKKW
jgi:Ca-activated chloride channel family protein